MTGIEERKIRQEPHVKRDKKNKEEMSSNALMSWFIIMASNMCHDLS